MSSSYPPLNIEMEPWVSATQISTYELCNRKWGFKWLDRIYAPPNKFAQLGIDTHGRLEDWLKFGVVPDGDSKDHKLARAMIPYLPAPQLVDPNNVERDELVIVEDVLFNVKIDLFMPQMPSWDGVTLRPRVCDHKVTKDPELYAPAWNEIHFDPQAALYAAWGIIFTGQTVIDLQWNYVKREGATKVHPVCATVTDAMITPRMQANIETGRAIKAHLAQTKRALDIVPDPRACDEYGGCPYRESCGISARERIVGIMSDFKGQTATQQFLQGLGTGPTNGQAVNPPQFQPPQGAPQFAPPQGAPQFAPPQGPPQFAPPQGAPQFAPPQAPQAPQFAPPPQAPQAPQFVAPPAPQQSQFAVPPQAPPQPQYAPPQGPPQFAPPQPPPASQQYVAPPQPPQFAPPPQAPQFSPQPPPGPQGATAPAAEGKKGKQPKEHDMGGCWAMFMAAAITRASNVQEAAAWADQATAELKARQ